MELVLAVVLLLFGAAFVASLHTGWRRCSPQAIEAIIAGREPR